VIGALADHLQDVYLCNKTDKDAGTNYKMVDGKGVVEQAHDIHCIVRELELLKIVVLDEFVVGGIIAKLPPSWRDFVTTIKHKWTDMSISDLIASLDVEEKGRAKYG
jgi:hypothetical protein